MLLADKNPTVQDFAAATSWTIEQRGACQGELCVPLAPGTLNDGRVDLTLAADRLGMAVVEDADAGLVAVGPATFAGSALSSTACPDLVLPTFDGDDFDLRSLRGQRVVLVAWAPY